MYILRRSAGALVLFPMFAYLSYTTYEIKVKLGTIKDEKVMERRGKGWVEDNIQRSSNFIAITWFLFGEHLLNIFGNFRGRFVDTLPLPSNFTYNKPKSNTKNTLEFDVIL